MTTTVNKIREEFVEKYKEYIVSVDHNVADDYNQEFSFHAVCHPEVTEEGNTIVPPDMQDYLEDISEKHIVQMVGTHIHINIQVSRETLGIEQRFAEDPQQKPSVQR